MSGRALGVLVVVLALGCGRSGPAARPPVGGRDPSAVPPAQMRMVLEGLKSDHPRVQQAALEVLSRFPSAARTYRQQIERLQNSSPNPQVRQKAAELLGSLGG